MHPSCPGTRHTTPRSLTHPVVTKQTPERGGSPVAGLGPLAQDEPMPTSEDVLAGWSPAPFTAAGVTHDVYIRGEGPGVVLLPEMPGMTPRVMGLANHLVGEGFTVAVPSLFGEPGRDVSAGYALRTISKACTTRELAAFARGAERPIAEYVRALARHLHGAGRWPGRRRHRDVLQRRLRASGRGRARRPRAGGQPAVRAVPAGRGPRRDLGMSEREQTAIAERVRTEGLCLIGLRFSRGRDVTGGSGSPNWRRRSVRAGGRTRLHARLRPSIAHGIAAARTRPNGTAPIRRSRPSSNGRCHGAR